MREEHTLVLCACSFPPGSLTMCPRPSDPTAPCELGVSAACPPGETTVALGKALDLPQVTQLRDDPLTCGLRFWAVRRRNHRKKVQCKREEERRADRLRAGATGLATSQLQNPQASPRKTDCHLVAADTGTTLPENTVVRGIKDIKTPKPFPRGSPLQEFIPRNTQRKEKGLGHSICFAAALLVIKNKQNASPVRGNQTILSARSHPHTSRENGCGNIRECVRRRVK